MVLCGAVFIYCQYYMDCGMKWYDMQPCNVSWHETCVVRVNIMVWYGVM